MWYDSGEALWSDEFQLELEFEGAGEFHFKGVYEAAKESREEEARGEVYFLPNQLPSLIMIFTLHSLSAYSTPVCRGLCRPLPNQEGLDRHW